MDNGILPGIQDSSAYGEEGGNGADSVPARREFCRNRRLALEDSKKPLSPRLLESLGLFLMWIWSWSSSIQRSKATATQPGLGYSGHTLDLASAPFHPPSSCQSECPQTEPSHITSLTGPCQLSPRVFWVKFNLLAHLVKRALPICSQLNLPPHHLPQHAQQLMPTKALRWQAVSHGVLATPAPLPCLSPESALRD